jgi:hypothetical protein
MRRCLKRSLSLKKPGEVVHKTDARGVLNNHFGWRGDKFFNPPMAIDANKCPAIIIKLCAALQ